MINDAVKIHNFSPACAKAFGEVITACSYMSSMLKNDGDKLSVVLAGNGFGGKITVCGNGKLQMRGYMENPCGKPRKTDNEDTMKDGGHSAGEDDAVACVGKEGRLTAVISMGLKEPYSGSCALSGTVAQDFESYFATSEQTPTAVLIDSDFCGSACVRSFGVFVQAMPGASAESLKSAVEAIEKLSLQPVSKTYQSAEEIMKTVFGNEAFETYFPEYKCLCDSDYIEKMLIALGEKETSQIVKEEGEIVVKCEFCNKEYRYNQKDLDRLFHNDG